MPEPQHRLPVVAGGDAPGPPASDTPVPATDPSRVDTDFTFDPLSGFRPAAGAEATGGPPPVTDDQLVGIAVGDIVIERCIAAGGMGRVYLGRQRRPDRPVAVKFMRHVRDPDMAARFHREVQFLGRLSHPHVARIFTAGEHRIGVDSVPFYSMEFVADAEPLVAYCRRRCLPAPDRLRIFLDACDGVAAGHAVGIVHRDLKPGNLLVGRSGDPPMTAASDGTATVGVKVIDFGIAKLLDADADEPGLTRTGGVVGTPRYMSPEQLAGESVAIDARCDVYALGVVLYELLGGRLPHDDRHRSFGAVAPPAGWRVARRLAIEGPAPGRRFRREVVRIVATCLEPRPADRYASAGELAGDVRRLLAGDGVARRRRPAVRESRRRGLLLLGGATAATLAAIVVGRRPWRAVSGTAATVAGGFSSRVDTRPVAPLQWVRLDFAEPPAAALTPDNFRLLHDGRVLDVRGLAVENRDGLGTSWIVRGLEPLTLEEGRYVLQLRQDGSAPRTADGRPFTGPTQLQWHMPPYRTFRFDLLDDAWREHVVAMEGLAPCRVQHALDWEKVTTQPPLPPGRALLGKISHTVIRPTEAGREGRLVMAFHVDFPIRHALLSTVLAVWTRGDPQARDPAAEAHLDVSPDGDRWTTMVSLVPGDGGLWTGPLDILPVVEDARAVWVRVRLAGSVALPDDAVVYTQFMRTHPDRPAPTFRLDLSGSHIRPSTDGDAGARPPVVGPDRERAPTPGRGGAAELSG